MDSLWRQLILIVILILINAFFAGSEIAVISMRQTRIRQLVNRGNRSARILARLARDSGRFLSTIQIGVTISGFLASATAAVSLSLALAAFLKGLPVSWLKAAAEPVAVVVVTVVLSYVTLLFGELAPKNLAIQQSERIALAVARPLDWFSRFVAPLAWLLARSSAVVVKALGGSQPPREPRISEEELKILVNEQGSLQDEEKEMIQGVFKLDDTMAREIMVPRPDIRAISAESKISEAVEILVETGFSRLPVYQDELDNILGIVNVKDALAAAARQEGDQPVASLAKKALFVPPTKRVLDLLRVLKSSRQHLAVIVDEYGSVDGLVSMKDIIEEIVGSIEDENQKPVFELQRIDDRTFLVHGSMNIMEINRETGFNLPETLLYETVGGLVMNALERVPERGDEVKVGELLIKVKEMDANRVEKVLIKRNKPIH